MKTKWYTEATDIVTNKNGITTGYISSEGESYPFMARIGCWAKVGWPTDKERKELVKGHKIAATYATVHFVKNFISKKECSS